MSIDFSNYGKVSMNQLNPGTVIFAHVPFRDNPAKSKTRPVVVIERRGRSIVGCAIYTKPAPGDNIQIVRHNRTSYIDTRAVLLDRYQFVGVEEDELDDDAWDVLADSVVWGDL